MGCKGRQSRNGGWLAGILCGLVLFVALLPGSVVKATDSREGAPTEEALAVVRDCMAQAPAPWPEAWQREYLDTIREASVSHKDAPQYARRLEILSKGFPAYWEGLRKAQERSSFEVHCAQIRWYAETLMSTELPGEEETQTLRHQYGDLCEYTARSLLAQFPFLDPNAVHKARADHLAECYRNIEVPLLPIFLTPISQTQMEQIKQRWHDLRYARVDLWRQLGRAETPSPENRVRAPVQTHPDYLLMQRSLAQLRPHIWAIIAPAPDHYRSAVAEEIDAQRRHAELRSQARSKEMHMDTAVSQAEYVSFLLAALLETADCFHEEKESERAEQPKEAR